MAVDVGSAVGYLDLDISGFLANLQTAQSEASKRSSNIATKVGKNIDAAGQKLTSAGSTLTKTVTLPVVGVGTAVVKMSSSFESAMSRVQAISGASGKDLQDLNKKAQQLGATTAFSASEVADGMTEMAKAGWNSSQIMAGMEGVLNAASASGEDLASVSTIVADAITGFGLEAEDASRVADLLTQAANAGTIDITDLGESFKYIAPIAKTMNFSIEDVTTAIAAMSMAGIKGSQAGTSLRTALARMVKPTDAVKAAMDELGIVLTNEDGSFKSLNTIVAEMRGKFSGMSDEQKTYYATVLAGQEGMSGLLSLLGLTQEEYDSISDSMNNCKDVAKDTADTMLDNLGGQVTILKSSLEGLAIQFGEIILPYLKQFVQWIQDVTTKLQQLSPEQKQQIVKWAAIAAAIGPVLVAVGKVVSSFGVLIGTLGKIPGAFSTMHKGITSAVTGLKNVGEGIKLARAGFPGFASEASTLGAAIGGITAPVVAVVAIIAALVAAFATLWNTNEDFRNNIINTWNEIKDTISGFCDGIVERLNALGFDFEDITDVLKTIWFGFCDLVAPVFEGAFQTISNTISTVLGVITGILDIFIGLFTGNWDQCWEGVKEVFGSIWEGLVSWFSTIIDTIKGIADTICGWFGTTWNETWQGIKDFFVGIWEGIVQGVTDAWDSIVSFVTSIPTNVATFFSNLWTTISDWFVDLVSSIAEWFQELIDNTVAFLEDFKENWPYYLGKVIGHVIAWAVKMKDKAKETGRNFLESVVTFVKELPGKVLSFITKTLSNVAAWATKMKDKAKQTGKNFVESVTTFIKELPGKAKEWLEQTISKVTKWASDMKKEAKDAGEKFVTKVTDGAKELPGKLKEWLEQTIQKCSDWVGDMKKKGTDAIEGLIDKVIDGAKAIPEKMAEIGQNIVDGVWDGIQNAKETFKENVGKFFNGIVDGIKEGLGIHSPSRVMRDQVGKNIALGVIQGINNEADNVGKSVEEMGNIIITQAKKTYQESLENNKMSVKQAVQYWQTIVNKTKQYTKANAQAIKQYNKAVSEYQQSLLDATDEKLSKLSKIQDVSAAKEAKYWQKCLKTLKEGTYEYKVALKNYNDAVEQMESNRLSSAETKLKKLQAKESWNAKNEVDYWNQVLSTVKKGTSAYSEALTKYKEANASLKTSVKQLKADYKEAWKDIKDSLANDVQSVVDEYNKTLTSRISELKSQMGSLFSAYEMKQTTETKESLKANLQSQISALDEWKKQMDVLSVRVGDNDAFIEEVRDLGIDSTEQIKLLNSMTDDELKDYLALWKKKNKEANSVATSELADYKTQCEQQIKTLTDTATKQLDELNKEYKANLKSLGVSSSKQSFAVGKDIVKGIQKGITSQDKDFQKYLKSFFKSITTNAKETLGIHSPSKVFAEQVGKWLPAGMASGFVSAMPEATDDINDAINDGIKGIDSDEVQVGGVETFAKTLKMLYNDIAVFFEDIEQRLSRSIDSMTDELTVLMKASKTIATNQDDMLGYVGYSGFVVTKDTDQSSNSNDTKPVSSGDTYNFYSQAKLSEVECRNEMIQAKKELALDF